MSSVTEKEIVDKEIKMTSVMEALQKRLSENQFMDGNFTSLNLNNS